MIDLSHTIADGVVADVVIVGDGPAGSALAAALHRRGVDVALVGPGEPWAATYTTWVDDLDDVELLAGARIWAHRFEHITVRFGRSHVIDRPYGVVDNEALRTHLQRDLRHVVGVVEKTAAVHSRLTIDATGWPSALADPIATRREPAGWQTAFGVVLAEAPIGPLGQPTMMDFSHPGAVIADRPSIPTFAYSLPVPGGWLVEETVLSASPEIGPEMLCTVLAARLGTSVDELLDAAISTETVRIPMGVSPPGRRDRGLVCFGAAAGMIHPATGYSIGSALRNAERVAAAVAAELARRPEGGALDPDPVHRAVWPASARRTRHLHDYGHDVLRGLDRNGMHRFFDAFFELPIDTWSPYLRIDTTPHVLTSVMATMFRRAPWKLRARLVSGDPRRLIRMLFA